VKGTDRHLPLLPTRELLRQVVDPDIDGCTSTVLKSGTNLTRVYRVILTYPEGHPGPSPVILKAIAPEWPDDPNGADREFLFYRRLQPRLDIPRIRVFHAGVDPSSGYRTVVMEDIGDSFRFPPPTHLWTAEEARCMMRTYARLHASGRNHFDEIQDRSWLYQIALQRRNWQSEELVLMVDALVGQGLDSFWSAPCTVLHNDVYPPNVALPRDLQQSAILFDWEMAGYGPAELDLAYMFLQPFRSARSIDRAGALEYYWEQRKDLEGHFPSGGHRGAMQTQADAVWALSLVPVAYKVASKPYSSGSAPAAYWTSMIGVLEERLRELCAAI